jgi:hypothetical protein
MTGPALRTRVVAVVFAAGCMWWLCHVPYEPRRLLRVIPPGATVVTSHYNLAGRWEALTANPLGQPLREMLQNLAGTHAERALRWLASRDVVAAYAPSAIDSGEPLWVFAAWMGARSHAVHWWLRLRGDVRLQAEEGRQWWRATSPLSDGRHAYLLFREGTLVVCIAGDSRDLAALEARMFRQRDSLLSYADAEDIDWLLEPERRDRFWVRSRWSNRHPLNLERVRADLKEVTGRNLRARIRVGNFRTTKSPDRDGIAGDVLQTSAWKIPAAMHGSAARTVLQGPGSSLRNLLDVFLPRRHQRFLGELLASARHRAVMIVVAGGEYGGRLKGIRVPALNVCVELGEGEDSEHFARNYLQVLNHAYRTDFVLTPRETGQDAVYAIDSRRDDDYAGRPPSERAAVAVVGHWMIFSTSRLALDAVLERRDWARGPAGDARAVWFGPDPVGNEIHARGWSDLGRTGKSVRNLLALSSMMEMQSGSASRAEVLKGTAQFRDWIECVQALRSARLEVMVSDRWMECRLELGDTE